MGQIIVTIITGLIIFVGLAGSILPFIPGPPLSLVGLILYAVLTHFQTASITAILIFSGLVLLNILFDIFAPAIAAKGYKASKYGVWGAVIGGMVGLFVLPPLGPFVGPLIGGYIGEFILRFDHKQAVKAAWGAFIGMLLGTAFKFIVALSIFIYFLIAVVGSIRINT